MDTPDARLVEFPCPQKNVGTWPFCPVKVPSKYFMWTIAGAHGRIGLSLPPWFRHGSSISHWSDTGTYTIAQPQWDPMLGLVWGMLL